MKWKLKYSNFDEETGISKVIISTSLGDFEGQSYLHEEDRDIMSQFTGCRYAELRAVMKFARAKIRNQQIKVSTLKNLIENLEKINNYDKDAAAARFIRKTYFIEQERLDK